MTIRLFFYNPKI